MLYEVITQWSDADKQKASAVIVRNDADLPALSAEADRALSELRTRRLARVRSLHRTLAAFWRGENVAFLPELGFEF